MSIFHVICNMTISQCGPVVGYELVHLRQGDMDGACGPYSLMMCLILQGVVRREDVVALNNLDGRTALGKLWNKFQDFHALFRQGTTLQDIGSLLATFGRKIKLEAFEGTGVDTRKFIYRHLKDNHPVILGIYGEDLAHWVVAIGWEDMEGDDVPERFLLLDSSYESPRTSCWNAVINLDSAYGRYPYLYWWNWQMKGLQVALNGALALF